MGKLDKYARQSRSKEASKVLPIRLPESIYEQFRERCDELGLSMSEAGYLLIREELEENLYTTTTNEVAATTGRIQKSIQDENTPYIKKTTNSSSSFSSRWTSAHYEVENELPCPLCHQWYSKTNFARHAKNHNTTTKELLENNKEFIFQMIKERKHNA
ncbi:hypothetical protein [Priestia megaterium]|uniref:hypothetical protein n=1 Tax=Priestia megaterium TaxID=1404 RepID=UPI0004255D08|nr:hypothetical protein [Priestia megaterium]MCU7766688.1 hypothetical protein [Priestia megaterium]